MKKGENIMDRRGDPIPTGEGHANRVFLQKDPPTNIISL